MATATTDHYTIISADTHAGANHETYREYLDAEYVPDFDAWREKYKNPWKDLRDTSLRVRNWDDERRNTDQNADGVVGEVHVRAGDHVAQGQVLIAVDAS